VFRWPDSASIPSSGKKEGQKNLSVGLASDVDSTNNKMPGERPEDDNHLQEITHNCDTIEDLLSGSPNIGSTQTT
jgi:hypothetical protein